MSDAEAAGVARYWQKQCTKMTPLELGKFVEHKADILEPSVFQKIQDIFNTLIDPEGLDGPGTIHDAPPPRLGPLIGEGHHFVPDQPTAAAGASASATASASASTDTDAELAQIPWVLPPPQPLEQPPPPQPASISPDQVPALVVQDDPALYTMPMSTLREAHRLLAPHAPIPSKPSRRSLLKILCSKVTSLDDATLNRYL